MGIADLWKLLAPSEKSITLEELANDYHSKHRGKRGLRVAIDVALWIFQSRASVVGDQSELRTLFFRFCRLYELGIRPVFVFDGPDRPSYKRNNFINTIPIDSEYRRNLVTMIDLFGFAQWTAYGEAEAECALLQRLGFVDFVLTGDSDIFLFGAKRIIRQWPQKRQQPIPCYDITWISDTLGLDRSDLILIALLRGSDYDTSGTSGIGVKVAAQLAKCHYHRELMDDIQLAGRDTPLDEERVQHLFDNLTYELQHNGTRNLTRKYPNMVLDPRFPDFSIIIDFIHPLTNIGDNKNTAILKDVKKLQDILNAYLEPHWLYLAPFLQTAFRWPAEYTLKRLSKLLFPGYMTQQLKLQQPSSQSFMIKQTGKNKILSVNDKDHIHTQRRMNDYFSSSQEAAVMDTKQQQQQHHAQTQKKFTRNRKFEMIVRITNSKAIYNNSLKLYRVEWNKLCWHEFLEKIRPRLDTITFEKETVMMDSQHDAVGKDDTEEEAQETEGQAYKTEKAEVNVWETIKRQWVNAIAVHQCYPSIAIEYQGKSLDRKRSQAASSSAFQTMSSHQQQSTLDSFLILPNKRRRPTSTS
ncbi:PIN domain-like protein [Mycotypha africana]|uniref:PIN domain-like protein n=1 Tax=Mycotypha africana TaxID=64632 RepID=UPI002300D278|nr:PIN domain-like protein [Mycotypha africana]KAI8973354.1 PIN domain-like protein [Mycotypha africana]